LRRLTLGSDAELVLRESPVPVLLVRARDSDAAD
jgi:nucleotide-binding universal stress UspA family protein